MVTVSIKVQEETKEKLDELKEHPRATYDDVIDIIASGAILEKQRKEKEGK